MSTLLWQFSYLQILDLLTTVAFLLYGVQEGNPVVRWAMATAPSPLWGLIWVKAAAMLLGMYCFWWGRQRLLGRINLLFAAVVVWNVVALIDGAMRASHGA